MLIVVAALAFMREAYWTLLTPRPIAAPELGLSIDAAAGVINATRCLVRLRNGRRRNSPALLADPSHLWTDVVSSFAVLLGVMLVVAAGWQQLDPILAALVAINILWSGSKPLRESVGGLMDEAIPESELAALKEVVANYANGAFEAHDLRARRSGRATFVEFHLVVPGAMTVRESHAICDRIEDALHERVPHATIVIHVEPETKAKPGADVTIR